MTRFGDTRVHWISGAKISHTWTDRLPVSVAGMDVLIAGGHGKIARHLIRLLAAGGHTARGIIRNPAHAADLEADGGIAVVCDLEREDVRPHVGGADAIVFAAGAGPGSGAERKRTVDYGAAVKCVEAAEELGRAAGS